MGPSIDTMCYDGSLVSGNGVFGLGRVLYLRSLVLNSRTSDARVYISESGSTATHAVANIIHIDESAS